MSKIQEKQKTVKNLMIKAGAPKKVIEEYEGVCIACKKSILNKIGKKPNIIKSDK